MGAVWELYGGDGQRRAVIRPFVVEIMRNRCNYDAMAVFAGGSYKFDPTTIREESINHRARYAKIWHGSTVGRQRLFQHGP